MSEDYQSNNINELKALIENLNEKIDQQGQRIERLERGDLSAKAQEIRTEVGVGKEIPPALEHYTVETEANSSNLEELIGGRWLAKIGVIAVIFATAFFLKYTFDHGWINEVARVLIGVIAGFLMLGFGEKVVKKYNTYGHIVSGGGLALLYLSIFSSFAFYDLISYELAFLFMATVTAIGVLLSIRHDAKILILFSALGGYLTPLLLSQGNNDPLVLFLYLTILNIAVLYVSSYKGWRWLDMVGLIATYILLSSWLDSDYNESELYLALIIITLLYLLFNAYAIFDKFIEKGKSHISKILIVAFSGFMYFFTYRYLMDGTWMEDVSGIFAAGVSVFYLLTTYIVYFVANEDDDLAGIFGVMAAMFAAIAAYLHFDDIGISISWTMIAFVMIFAGAIKKSKTHEVLSVAGLSLGFFSIFRMLSADYELYNRGDMLLLNKAMLPVFVATIFCYLAAYFIYKYRYNDERDNLKILDYKKVFASIILAANVLLIVAVSRDIYVYGDNLIYDIRDKSGHICEHYTGSYDRDTKCYKTGEYQESEKKVDDIEYMTSIGVSLFWLAYSIILMVIGFSRKIKLVRIGGLSLLFLSIFKLFLVDLWHLGQLYRIVASLSLGLVLLGISFLYNKYKNIFTDQEHISKS